MGDVTFNVSGAGTVTESETPPAGDTTQPTVTSVGVPANGTYRENQTLTFTINTDEAVAVTGAPNLALTIGGTARTADYKPSDSTGTALKFDYAVQAGDTDTDGIEIGALSVNGGTIKDAAGNDLVLTLNSKGDTSGVKIDTTAPTVTGVDVPAAKTYLAGETLTFTVIVNEPVNVTGTPNLGLTIGNASRSAAYTASGSTGTALKFTYSIPAGDADADGIEVGTLTLNGGTIKDVAGNDLVLTLNGLGDTEDVLVDAVVPSVTSVGVPTSKTYIEGETMTFTVNVSEAVSVTGTPNLALTIGSASRTAAYTASGSTGTALKFAYAVQAGDADSDGVAVGALTLNGGTIVDSSGNALVLTLNSVGSTTGVLVDAAAPTVTSVNVPADKTYVEGETLTFMVNVSEPVAVTGSPSLALTIGDESRTAVYTASGSTATSLKFAYAVQAGDLDLDGIEIGVLTLN
ncbi:MAG: hypothetical protein J7559_20495, partial [Cohnella sp.]|nr:hypothetical protein [Cohnella sp.]